MSMTMNSTHIRLVLTLLLGIVALLAVVGSASASRGAEQATDEYVFPKDPRPGIQVRDNLYKLVSRVRLGRSYEVIPDLGAGTYSDPEILYLCFKTGPSGRFKCQLAWATNLYDAAYPEGATLTVTRKHIFSGRVWIRVLDVVDKRVIFARALPVTGG